MRTPAKIQTTMRGPHRPVCHCQTRLLCHCRARPGNLCAVDDCVGAERAVVNHNSCPAQKLRRVQKAKKLRPEFSKRQSGSLHGGHFFLGANHACHKQKRAAKNVSDYNRRHSFCKAQRREISSGNNFRDGNSGSKPNQRTRKNSHINSKYRKIKTCRGARNFSLASNQRQPLKNSLNIKRVVHRAGTFSQIQHGGERACKIVFGRLDRLD